MSHRNLKKLNKKFSGKTVKEYKGFYYKFEIIKVVEYTVSQLLINAFFQNKSTAPRVYIPKHYFFLTKEYGMICFDMNEVKELKILRKSS